MSSDSTAARGLLRLFSHTAAIGLAGCFLVGCSTPLLLKKAKGESHTNEATGETTQLTKPQQGLYVLVPFAVAVDIVTAPFWGYWYLKESQRE